MPDGMAAASRCSPKQLGQALRMDKLAELVGEHEVRVDVRVSGECAREDLRLLVCAQHVDRLGASATVRRERADFGGPNVQPARVGTSCCFCPKHQRDKQPSWSGDRDCARCQATTDLRACHITPLARGGGYDPDDARLLCRKHDKATDPYAR